MNRKRTIILNTAIIFGFFAIFLRLTFLMVFDHKLLAEKAKSQQIKAEEIQVRRGNIYDRRGRAFAVNLELESLFCDSREVVIDNDKVNKLSITLGMEPSAVLAKFQPEKRFTWVNRKLSPDKAKKIKEILQKYADDMGEITDKVLDIRDKALSQLETTQNKLLQDPNNPALLEKREAS